MGLVFEFLFNYRLLCLLFLLPVSCGTARYSLKCFLIEPLTPESTQVNLAKNICLSSPPPRPHPHTLYSHKNKENKSIANDCVIPRHCKHFHSPIFSNRFIFFVSTLSRAAKPHGAWNKIYVLTRHFITLFSYYKLPVNHFPLLSYSIFVKISEKKIVKLMILYRFC